MRAAIAAGGHGLELIPHPQATQQLADVLQQLWYESYAAGRHAAQVQLKRDAVRLRKAFNVGAESAWDSWQPGNVTAGSYAAEGGLASVLANQGVALQGITDTTLTRVGNAISDGLSRGDSVDTLAKSLRDLLGSANRAELIAHTESARLLTMASLDQYSKEGIRKWNWVLSAGACRLCVDYAAKNPHDSQDLAPPGHPRCRCAVAPDLDSLRAAMAQQIDEAVAGSAGSIPDTARAFSTLREDRALRGVDQLEYRMAADQAFLDWCKPLIRNLKLTKDEKAAIREYTKGWFQEVNQPLRNGNFDRVAGRELKFGRTAQSVLDDLDTAVARSVIPEDLVTYRRYRATDRLAEGDVFTDKAFQSTSAGSWTPGAETGSKTTLMRILIPEGSHALPVAPLGQRGEMEVILARGSKLKVLKVHPDGMIDVVLLP